MARRRLLLVTFEPVLLKGLWIAHDYFPEILALKRRASATSERLAALLPKASIQPLPVPRDCADLFFAALWARPEMLLDDAVVRPMWVWQSISAEGRREGRERLAADLASGAWERRYGHLRTKAELDVGLRLVVSELDG